MSKFQMSSVFAFMILLLLNLASCGIFRSNFNEEVEKKYGHDTIFGDYYLSDGWSDHTRLRLKPDSTFEANGFGCMGEHGSAKGTWTIVESMLTITVEEEKGIMGYPRLDKLLIQNLEGHWLFVPHDNRFLTEFKLHGPSKDICFQKSDQITE